MSSDLVIRCDNAQQQPIEGRTLRFDAGSLGALERTPTGGVRVPARVTREGVLVYHRADGTQRREYRPAEEVFRADSLASLADCAVTIAHPSSGRVTPETFKADSVGYIRDAGRRDDRFVATSLVVQDDGAIKRIDSGELRELSCGYACRVEMTSGVTPSGERYDAIQRDITYNHVALLPRGGGRAGRDVALRIDGAGAELGDDSTNTNDRPAPGARAERTDGMKTQRIDGIEYEVGSTAWAQACERRDARVAAENAALEERAKTAEAKVAETQAKLDASDKLVKKLEAELTPAKLDSRVSQRAALVAQVAPVLGADVKLDGKTDLEIMALALAKLDPEFKADSLDEGTRPVYMRARFEAEIKHLGKRTPLQTARSDAFGGAPPGTQFAGLSRFGADDVRPRLDDKWRRGPTE